MAVSGFQVVRPIGRGGAGEVLEAVRVGPGGFRKAVALKRLVADRALSGRARQRFLDEARVTAQLDHPNLVRVHDVVAEGGDLYMVMDLLRGATFATVIDGLRAQGAVPWWLPLAIAAQALDGLAYAHAATGEDGRPLGLVHRDLTPRNLFVCRDGSVRVLDFGIAKHRERPSLTSRGHIQGTIDFLSPEQARGERVDARSDLYQLGAALYWALTGRSPHGDGTAGEVLARAAVGMHEAIAGVPAEVAAVVERAMAADPAARFADAAAMAAAVRALLDPAQHGPAQIAAVVASTVADEGPEATTHTISATGGGNTEGIPAVDVAAAPVRARAGWWIAAALALAGAAAAVAYVAGAHARATVADTAQPTAATFQRLTTRRGLIGRARFLPGANAFVYAAAWEGGPLAIYQGTPGNALGRPLDLPPADIAAIGNDGQMLVLIDPQLRPFRRGNLATVPVGGGAPRELVRGVAGADVAADGRIAAVHYDGERWRIEYPLGTVVDTITPSLDTTVRISPSGARVAYIDHPAGNDPGVVKIAGPGEPPHAIGAEWPSVHTVLWVDDAHLWVSGTRSGGHDYLAEVALDGSERVLYQGTTDLFLMDRDARGRLLVGSVAPLNRAFGDLLGSGRNAYLTLFAAGTAGFPSPDGAWILATTYLMQTGADFAVYRVAVDGKTAPIKLADGLPFGYSPDGQSVLVRSSDGTKLRVVPVGAGAAEELAMGPVRVVNVATWFPNGNVVLSGPDANGVHHVVVIDRATHTTRTVGRAAIALAPAAYSPMSPDGTHVLAIDTATRGVLLLSLPDGGERALPQAPRDSHAIGWSTDGAFAYLTAAGARGAVSRLEVATGNVAVWKELPPLDDAALFEFGPTWMSADGTRYLGIENAHPGSFFLVEGLR